MKYIIALILISSCSDTTNTICPCTVIGVSTDSHGYRTTVQGNYTGPRYSNIETFTFYTPVYHQIGDTIK